MIRARHAPRPDAACHSADVLSPPERALARRDHCADVSHMVPRETKPAHVLQWGDVPRIAKILQSLRSKP